MRESVRVQVLPRQASEVHEVCGPGRPQVPLHPMHKVRTRAHPPSPPIYSHTLLSLSFSLSACLSLPLGSLSMEVCNFPEVFEYDSLLAYQLLIENKHFRFKRKLNSTDLLHVNVYIPDPKNETSTLTFFIVFCCRIIYCGLKIKV